MIKLFEEFNEMSGRNFVKKLRMFSSMSPYVISVSKTRKEGNSLVFNIETDMPGENDLNCKKSFKVIVPLDTISHAKVETYEKGKLKFETTLEPANENDEKFLVINFIEATSIYDDPLVQDLVDNFDKIKDEKDIEKIINHN